MDSGLSGEGAVGLKAIVDTNVLAYCLLRTEPFYPEAKAFWQSAEEAWAPDSWRAEFVNVLWLAAKAGAIELRLAERSLFLAERLVTRTFPARPLARAALRLAVASEHAAYDTLFVALAIREELPLATFEGALLRTFPETAVRPQALL